MEKPEPKHDLQKYDLIVACVGNSDFDEGIISAAYKKARLYGCPWQVLHVVVAESSSPPRMPRMLKKASVLEAETVQKTAHNVSEGIISHALSLSAEGRNILFLIGIEKGFSLPFTPKNTYNSVRRTLATHGIKSEPVRQDRAGRNYTFLSPIFNFNGITGMLEAAIYVSAAFLFCLIIDIFLPPHIPGENNSSIYIIHIIACLVSALRGGIIPGLTAAMFSLISINMFFLNPGHYFKLRDMSDVVNLLMFFFSSLLVSAIGSSSRTYIIASRHKEAYLNTLLSISETLNRSLSLNEAIAYIHHEIETLFDTDVVFFTPSLMDKSHLSLKYPASGITSFSGIEEYAFNTCRSEYISSGHLTATSPEAKWYFEPMMSASGFEGVLAVNLSASHLRHDSNIMGILLSLADLSATIIDRIERTQVIEETRIQQEKEKLRTMLLSSVSHDLKTPLASIIGSLDVYHNLHHKLSDEVKLSLTKTSYQEAVRLDSFITNILDMAKLESGIKLNMEPTPVRPLVERAITFAGQKMGNRKITNGPDKTGVIPTIDFNMFIRAMANLLDNISKYTPDDSAVNISYAKTEHGHLTILIEDNGPGIAANMLEEIFNKYTRISQQDSKIAGTGLGLPISRFIIEAHGGQLTASNNSTGASFRITLPPSA